MARKKRTSACSWAGSVLAAGTETMTTCRRCGSGHGTEVGQAGLLGRLALRDAERVSLARVTVAADLEPGLLARVPAQQHPGGWPGGRSARTR